MAQLTARTSTIFVAVGDQKTQVYRSVDEVPGDLRRKLVDTTRGMNSATILIADKRGREELVRALQGRPSDVQSRLVENIRSRSAEEPARPAVQLPEVSRSAWCWREIWLPLAAALSLWILLQLRFA